MSDEFRILNLRTIILLIAQIAVVLTFFLCQTQIQIWAALQSSIFAGIVLAFIFSWTTTLSVKYFVRKTAALLVLFSIFCFCFSSIPAAILSNQEFYESGDWAPMGPEVISVPLAILATIIGGFATISMWWLTTIVESPEPD